MRIGWRAGISACAIRPGNLFPGLFNLTNRNPRTIIMTYTEFHVGPPPKASPGNPPWVVVEGRVSRQHGHISTKRPLCRDEAEGRIISWSCEIPPAEHRLPARNVRAAYGPMGYLPWTSRCRLDAAIPPPPGYPGTPPQHLAGQKGPTKHNINPGFGPAFRRRSVSFIKKHQVILSANRFFEQLFLLVFWVVPDL